MLDAYILTHPIPLRKPAFSRQLVPVYIGIAYYAYSSTGEGKVFLVTLIACIAISAGVMVLKENCRKCRNCGYRHATDLAFKSNAMFSKLPVKVEEE